MVVKAVEKKTEEPVKLDNLAIWDLLKRTDPKATKPFQRAGGFRGSQIDPVWRMQMMTETFGPVGIGWGWEQLEWTIAERMIFVCCRVWYVEPKSGAKAFTGPQWGGTELVRRNRDGTERPDDEAFKMSITDAVGKCFLQIGLAADVYLGQFDDSKYREDSEKFFAADRSKKFLAQLQRTFPDMNTMSEYVNAMGRDGFQSSMREAEDHDPKTFAEIQALLDKTSERIASSFHADVKKDLEGIETLDQLEEMAPLWRSWLGHVRNKELKAKIGADIAAAKAALKAPPAAPGEREQDKAPTQDQQATEPTQSDPAAQTDGLPRFKVTKKSDGSKKWGMFTKQLMETIKAVPPETAPTELRMFWEDHREEVREMLMEGGDFRTYAQKVEAMYNDTLAILEAE